jgi:hypothetical protein
MVCALPLKSCGGVPCLLLFYESEKRMGLMVAPNIKPQEGVNRVILVIDLPDT